MHLDDDGLPQEGGPTKPKPDTGRDSSSKPKTLVRLIAGGFIVVGFLDVVVYWVKCKHDQVSPNLLHTTWLAIPLVIGVVILIKTPALAQRIEDWLDQ